MGPPGPLAGPLGPPRDPLRSLPHLACGALFCTGAAGIWMEPSRRWWPRPRTVPAQEATVCWKVTRCGQCGCHRAAFEATGLAATGAEITVAADGHLLGHLEDPTALLLTFDGGQEPYQDGQHNGLPVPGPFCGDRSARTGAGPGSHRPSLPSRRSPTRRRRKLEAARRRCGCWWRWKLWAHTWRDRALALPSLLLDPKSNTCPRIVLR